MSTKADYTDAEWQRLERAPIVAGMAISMSDPGGPIEAIKESKATVKTIIEAAQSGGRGALADEVTKSVIAQLTTEHKTPMGDFKPRGVLAGTEIIEELHAVGQLLTEKATPEEADGFRDLIVEAARRAAEAAKEGGFMGFHAERVSEGEAEMLEKVSQAVGKTA